MADPAVQKGLQRWFHIASLIALWVAFASTVCAPLMQYVWLLDLLTQFRVYWIPVTLALAVLFLCWRKKGTALVALGTCLFCITSLWRYSFAANPIPPDMPVLRVIAYNLRSSDRDATEIVEYLKAQSADVIILIEVKASWLRKLGELRSLYPHEIAETRPGAQGMWLLSRYPLRMVDADGISTAQRYPYISTIIDTQSGPVRFVGVHPSVPISLRGARTRNAQFVTFADIARRSTDPTILAGDFNCTPFSGHFRRMLGDGGLRDSAIGFGFRNTWHRDISFLPIDHVLISEGIGVSKHTIGPQMGSDHHPLVVDLHLPSANRNSTQPRPHPTPQ
ncbi:MAG: endonuclease/exonuclease/phosphatase family protein [Verrucomicrobiae bacterium]|nr:endonuclease/exonuclease/phosphatase family protein [Verrucomicrobiae bacterium]